MHINQHLIFGSLTDRFMQPRGPLLIAHINKAIFKSFDSPFFVEWQNLIQLCFQSPTVHINNNTFVFFFGIPNDLMQIKRTGRTLGINRNGRCIRFVIIFITIPTRIKMDVLNFVLRQSLQEPYRLEL